MRSDLTELGGCESAVPQLEISPGFRFADIFFNNVFTDLAVGQQIRNAQDTVDQSVQQIRALRDQLKNQTGTVTQRLAAMDAERRELLTQ
jgi:hypothetical protein